MMRPFTRRATLALLTIIFLLAGPGAVLYAYGWRIDPESFRLSKIGGIFLKDIPHDADVKVDGKPYRGIDELLTGTLIENLLPGTHRVTVDREGYRRWEKRIAVAPSGVTALNNIVLVPEKPEETPVIKGVVNFWVHGSRLIYEDARGVYFITDPDDPETRRTNLGAVFNDLKQKTLHYPGLVRILDIAPATSSAEWIITTANRRYLLDIGDLTLKLYKGPLPTPITLPKDARIPDRDGIVAVSSYDDSHLLLQYPEKLYLLELDTRAPLDMPLVASGVRKHAYDSGRLYLLRASGLTYTEL